MTSSSLAGLNSLTWPYSRLTGLVIFAQREEEEMGVLRPSGKWWLPRGGLVGETFSVILRDQFERLRDGDRFWYENYLSPSAVLWVENQTLARIIRRNTKIKHEIQDNVFIVP